ncbi:hypothetical protein PRUB_a2820 [Pseudoalteromonas rubra]|uniref:Uncharacterized protein n=1 Tax=Pseudoalteromonas rubra TaxID=43658 RepID=A0A8T0CC00_9GAMM|nr:hypothetical protein PRUB_a2820 [Pseudoalteromonas rubra]
MLTITNLINILAAIARSSRFLFRKAVKSNMDSHPKLA